MATQSDIPGLKRIFEETDKDGRTRFVFEIDDDRSEEFFARFGLKPGDEAGFEALVVEAINNFVRGGANEG